MSQFVAEACFSCSSVNSYLCCCNQSSLQGLETEAVSKSFLLPVTTTVRNRRAALMSYTKVCPNRTRMLRKGQLRGQTASVPVEIHCFAATSHQG